MKEFDNGLEKKWDYDLDAPVDSDISVEKLKGFLKPSDTLIFYGGEPLVMVEKMKEIMDNVNCRFMIQTNGLLLDKLPREYLMKLDKMLVSIDGTRNRDVENKGAVHYDKVVSNLGGIRAKGYSGEIVARMVVSEKPDIYEQVMAILKLELFDSVHWQIDAGFYKNDFDFKEFSEFVGEYNKSIDRLLDWWFGEIGKGEIIKMYPFVGILNRVKGWDSETRLPCGAGFANFTINTNGDLSACPIMNSVRNMYCGSMDSGVVGKKVISGCEECGYRKICGGRCLYWREAKLWPKEGDDLICSTIKYLIDGIRSRAEEIEGAGEKAIELSHSARIFGEKGSLEETGAMAENSKRKRKLRKEDFEFEKYFGPEIIP